MQQFLNLLSNSDLIVDLAISVLALSFMCALTYAMRWLPGKAANYKEPARKVVVSKHKAATSKDELPGRSGFVLGQTSAMEKNEAATIE
jgi:hypothetical protein